MGGSEIKDSEFRDSEIEASKTEDPEIEDTESGLLHLIKENETILCMSITL